MNEFGAKKIGEVLAFAEVGIETFEKAREVLGSIFGTERVEEIIRANEEHIERLRAVAGDLGVSEITLKKAEATGDKLRFMRDHYIGEEWDNPAELLEWLGFFKGAAIVHWQLVSGSAENLEIEELRGLANHGIDFNEGVLGEVSKQIKKIGSVRTGEI